MRLDRPGMRECRACNIEGARRFRLRKPLYDIWKTMIRRCSDPSFKDWSIYGGKTPPITVCERWLRSFEAFCEDMGPRPSSLYSIDRENGNLGYEPNNCHWATAKEQARNASFNRLITFNGDTKTLAEWVEISGLKYMTVFQRLERGWDFEKAITTPINAIPGHINRKRDVKGRLLPRGAVDGW